MFALLHTILTGEFLGYLATGYEEDSPIVIAAIAIHSILF